MNFRFRAWDLNRKEWICLLTPKNILHQCPQDGLIVFNQNFHAYNAEIQQWTGLQDINGKDIYVGDQVVVYPENYHRVKVGEEKYSETPTYSVDPSIKKPLKDIVFHKGVVEFDAPEYRVTVEKGTEISSTSLSNNWVEVIGNIFESPNLVKI